MEFLKKNYEKILLSLVLLGLAVAAAVLAFQVKQTQQEVQEMIDKVIVGVPHPAKGITSAIYDAMISQATNVVQVDLNVSNKVFNPSQWRRKPDGSLVKSDTLGANALRVKAVNPLLLIIEGIVSGNQDPPDYYLQFERQYEKLPSNRHPSKRTIRLADVDKPQPKVGDRVTYRIVEIKGNNPETLKIVLDLAIDGEKESVTITRDAPFKRALGYSADMDYPPDPLLKFIAKREGDDLVFAGETNNIVAIKKDSVLVSANSTGTRTLLPVKAVQ
jgi:hypothetical protein